jgi:pimeloyl-ACP methyl ester carboxylesterase
VKHVDHATPERNMPTTRIHRSTSADGTDIAGHVHGQGPPLVLVHGGVGSEESWRFLLPFLIERFTCFPMSLRGRGLSAESPDQRPERLIDDVVAFADSIGEPVGFIGHSSGGALALAAAAQATQVSSLAVYEPALPELDDKIRARYHDAFQRMGEAAAEDRLPDAAQIAFEDCAMVNDEELETLTAANATGFVAPNVPAHLRDQGFVDHRFLEPDRLEPLAMPILLLHGSRTHPFYRNVVDHLAELLTDAIVCEIDGAGHMGPLLVPEAVATELARFFAGAHVRT